MGIDDIIAVAWRRRWLTAITFLACAATVAAITFALPRTYQSTSTILASATDTDTPVDAAQSETLARTYSTLIASVNVAEAARARLPFEITRTELLRRVSFAPVERTPLVNVTAEAPTADEAQTIANTYVETASRVLNARLEQKQVAQRVDVVETAPRPLRPAKPSRSLYLGVGLVLAALLAVGVALLRDRLRPQLEIDPVADEVLGVPILARLPPFSTWHSTASEAVTDAFRRLRTNLQLVGGSAVRVVVITSPSVNEGKTSVSARLSLVAAGDGDPIGLVEADLRRPSLHLTNAGHTAKRRAQGLSSLATVEQGAARRPEWGGPSSLEDVVDRNVLTEGLSVVWAGSGQEDPAAALRSPALRYLLSYLATDSRWVIVDSPPMSVADDASVLSALADGVLYVVDARTTTAVAARAGLSQLARINARVLGVVVTNARAPSEEAYYSARREMESPERHGSSTRS